MDNLTAASLTGSDYTHEHQISVSRCFECLQVCINNKKKKSEKRAQRLKIYKLISVELHECPASIQSLSSADTPFCFFVCPNRRVPSTWRDGEAKSRGRWRLSCHEMKGAAIPSKWGMIRDLRSKHRQSLRSVLSLLFSPPAGAHWSGQRCGLRTGFLHFTSKLKHNCITSVLHILM